MMKKLVKLSLATLVVTALAACSSSGGGSDNKSSNTTSSKGQTTQTTQTTPSTNQTTTPSTNTSSSSTSYGDMFYMGKAFSIDDASKHPEKLIIAGREFTLEYPGIIAGTFSTLNVAGAKTVVNGSGSNHSIRFGYIEIGNRVAAFYQGKNPSTADSLKGTAKYVGDAVYAKAGQVATQVNKVALDVDFDNKKVAGTVFAAQDGIEAVTIKDATIDGNSFTGKVAQGSAEGDLKGKFFGNGGSEVGGVYSDGQGKDGWQGAFGANKQ